MSDRLSALAVLEKEVEAIKADIAANSPLTDEAAERIRGRLAALRAELGNIVQD